MPKSMVFHQNSNRYSYTKSRHAEGKWMKQHTEIDDFFCTSVHFGWLFGGRRFLVLIIKVTLSELSEASAPSIYPYLPHSTPMSPGQLRKGEQRPVHIRATAAVAPNGKFVLYAIVLRSLVYAPLRPLHVPLS